MNDWNPDRIRLGIARDLREISHLVFELHFQAIESPNARDFPGGTALHMLAPAAPIAEWEHEYETKEAEQRWDESGNDTWTLQPKLDPAIDQADAEEQPLNVLESWSRIVREERDQPTDLKPTISREVDYLSKNLTWATRVDEYGDPEWPAVLVMRQELRALVRSMENVLSNGPQPTDIPCTNLDCITKPLIHKSNARGNRDGYECPECKTVYNEAQYLQAIASNMGSEAAEKWVIATDATTFINVPTQTMRSWMAREKVRTQWVDGRLNVWWPDVREAAETRRRQQVAKTLSRGA